MLPTPGRIVVVTAGLADILDLSHRYNIAPMQPVATVLVLTGDQQLRLMRRGAG